MSGRTSSRGRHGATPEGSAAKGAAMPLAQSLAGITGALETQQLLSEEAQVLGGRQRPAVAEPRPAGPKERLMDTGARRVRVFVADDHAIVREGLAQLLQQQPDLVVVGTCAEGGESLQQIRSLLPDVAVLDISMPGLNGIEITEQLQQLGLPVAVVILPLAARQRLQRALAEPLVHVVGHDADASKAGWGSISGGQRWGQSSAHQ